MYCNRQGLLIRKLEISILSSFKGFATIVAFHEIQGRTVTSYERLTNACLCSVHVHILVHGGVRVGVLVRKHVPVCRGVRVCVHKTETLLNQDFVVSLAIYLCIWRIFFKIFFWKYVAIMATELAEKVADLDSANTIVIFLLHDNSVYQCKLANGDWILPYRGGMENIMRRAN